MLNWSVIPATSDDAPKLSKLMRKLESENSFMMYEASEIPREELLRERLTASEALQHVWFKSIHNKHKSKKNIQKVKNNYTKK